MALASSAEQVHAELVISGVGQSGIYLLVATCTEGRKKWASYLLQWRVIEQLRSCVGRFYDLGGINPETNPGVYHYKAGTGVAEVKQVGRFELDPGKGCLQRLHSAERFHRLYQEWRSRAA